MVDTSSKYNDLVLVYCSIVRSIVEYASPVWAAIPLCLDELIESVQQPNDIWLGRLYGDLGLGRPGVS